MNNFNKLEKALKSFLKTKISITTATVVGVLITGGLSFAQDIKPINIEHKEKTVVNEKGTTVQWIRTENKKAEDGIHEIPFDNIKVINNGDIKFEINGVEDQKTHGIRINAKNVEIENNGTITGERKGDRNKIVGIEAIADEKGKIVNNGTINIKNPANKVQQGIGILTQGKNITVENNGVISVAGKGTGVQTDGNFINNSTGIIDLSQAKNSTAILGYNSKIENKGTIKLAVNNTNNKAIITHGDIGNAINNGKIIITDKTAEQLKDFNSNTLFNGIVVNKGMLVGSDGKSISQKNDIVLSDKVNSETLNKVASENKDSRLVISFPTTIEGSKETIKVDSLNIGNKLTITDKDSNSTKFDGTTINLDKNGGIDIGNSSSLSLNNTTINGDSENKSDIAFKNDNSNLILKDTTINGNIGENNTNNGSIQASGKNNISGNINVKTLDITDGNFNYNSGNLNAKTINIGSDSTPKILAVDSKSVDNSALLSLNKDTTISKGSNITLKTDGILGLQFGEKGENALANSSDVTINGSGNILLDTSTLNVAEKNIDIGKNKISDVKFITNLDKTDGVYKVETTTASDNSIEKVTLKYNQNLYTDNLALSSFNNAALSSNLLFANTDLNARRTQQEKLYYGNIYSETVKSTYSAIKTNENLLRETGKIAEIGKWTATGNGVYNKYSYDRHDYKTTSETSGLLGVMEYGLDDTTSIGVALSGANQNIKAASGDADGTSIYLGTFMKKDIGNYKFNTGLGYQYNNYDANNTTGTLRSSDSYNSNSVSVFSEVKYIVDLNDNLTFQPKAKLGYTYINQDDASDSAFGVKNTNLSTFDIELGGDFLKTFALENGNLELKLGTSYVRLFGDTDKDFDGVFTKDGSKTNIKGAMLEKDLAKFDFSINLNRESGIFYNAGANYQVGSNNTRDYSIKLGAGYKF